MQHCDTLISVDWCIPVEPDRQVLEACSVAVADGRVVAVLPTSEARATFDARTVIDRPGHVLIPGFVNAHSHAAMTLMRGMADDLPLDRWLKEAVWPAEARWAGAEMVRDGTRLAIAELLLSGCTCLSDQYFFPEIVAETAADMNMRAMVGTPVTEYPTQWATSPAEYLSKGTDLVHDPFADHPLISTCFAPHSTLTVSDATFADLRVLADQLDKPVQIHLHESGQEVATSVDQTGKRPLERLQVPPATTCWTCRARCAPRRCWPKRVRTARRLCRRRTHFGWPHSRGPKRSALAQSPGRLNPGNGQTSPVST